MKKSLLLFSTLVIFAFTGLHAAVVSVPGAQNVALNFFKVTFPAQVGRNNISAVLKYTQTEPDGSVDFYVFDIKPINGFVMVSAHDEVLPVIAYSTESYFQLNFQKSGLQNWVNKTAGQIHNTVLHQIPADNRIQNCWTAYIHGNNPGSAKSSGLGPMLSTSWNQEPYFNAMCPINTNDGQYCVTGCVATAMAQIMKYWNYPAQGVGSHSYTDDVANGDQLNIGTLSANFGTTTYQWTQMPNYLTGNNTPIATLMSQCGISVNMDYSDGGSGAWVLQSEANAAYGYSGAPCAQYSYANYFLYNPATLQGVFQSNYTTLQWTNLLEAEMNAGRVVQYEGDDPMAGGHTWVCDGYDVHDNLHMNWGWGGAANGFYAVTNLSAGGYTFDYNDAALIGIEPLHPNVDTICTAAASFAYQSDGGTIIQFSNTSTSSHAFTSSWTFYNSQGQFVTSTATNPLITFTGQPPYSAQLVIVDTFYGGCRDTSRQAITFNPNTVCITLQHGSTKCTGASIGSIASQVNSTFSFSTGYSEIVAQQWTFNGVPGETRAFFQYDLSQIPAGSVIVNADLSLWADTLNYNAYVGEPTYGSNNACYLHQVTSPWSPTAVTWNNQPTVSNTNEVLLPQSTSYTENYLNVDVSNIVTGWVSNPSTNYGLSLQIVTQSYYNAMVFCSSAHVDTTKWPALHICFIPPNPCQAHASFIQQNLGAGQVRFTNTSTDTHTYTSSWTFYNSAGQFSTSTATNPVVTFTGLPPYSATLIITDSVCSDSVNQLANLSNCLTFQHGSTKCTGAQISSLPSEANTGWSYASGYTECFAEQWTNGGVPVEGRGLIQYDLSQIPVGSVITSAKLSLYADSLSYNGNTDHPTFGTDNTCYLHHVTGPWNPATVTWNTQPGTDTTNEVELAQSTNLDENYLNLDVSSFVQGWVNNPGTNYGMMLQIVTPNRYNAMVFCSSAYADTTKWPRLDICYQVPSPCHLVASFYQQNFGNGQVQFTNTSTLNSHTIVNWTFYNSTGAFSTSTATNPLVTFTGTPPFSASVSITDTLYGCIDTLTQPVNITTCLTLQGAGVGAAITSYPSQASDNYNYAGGFSEILAEQWTANGTPIELRSLLQYDLSQIPTGTTILSADLSLYPDTMNSNGRLGQPTFGTANACYLEQITGTWNPTTVTWNNQPATTTAGEVLLAQSTSTNEAYTNMNVAGFVQGWVNNPSTNNGMMLQIITQNYYNSLIFCSPSHPDASKHPLLQVCYFTPAPPSGCAITDWFTYHNLAGDTVQFTNYSTSNQGLVSSWTFYNGNGQLTTSQLTNPIIAFSGPGPYSATLEVSDSSGYRGCIDTLSKPIKIQVGIIEPGTTSADLSIFPNPNNGNSFYVRWPSGFDPQTSEVKAFDVLGREVPFGMLERHQEFCKLSMGESTSSGIYTIVVGNTTKQQCGKLVLVK